MRKKGAKLFGNKNMCRKIEKGLLICQLNVAYTP